MADMQTMNVTNETVEKENATPETIVVEKPLVDDKVAAPIDDTEEMAITTVEDGDKTSEVDAAAPVPDIRVTTATPETPAETEGEAVQEVVKEVDVADDTTPLVETTPVETVEQPTATVDAAPADTPAKVVDESGERAADDTEKKSRTDSLEVPPVDTREETMPAAEEDAIAAPTPTEVAPVDKEAVPADSTATPAAADAEATETTVVEDVSTVAADQPTVAMDAEEEATKAADESTTPAVDEPTETVVESASKEGGDAETSNVAVEADKTAEPMESDEADKAAPVDKTDVAPVEAAETSETTTVTAAEPADTPAIVAEKPAEAVETTANVAEPSADVAESEKEKEPVAADAQPTTTESAGAEKESTADATADVVMLDDVSVSLIDETTTSAKVDTPKAAKRPRADDAAQTDTPVHQTAESLSPPPCKAARESVEQGMQTLPTAKDTANVDSESLTNAGGDVVETPANKMRRLTPEAVKRLATLDTRGYLNATVVPTMMGAMNDLVTVRPADPVQHVIDYMRLRRVRTLDSIEKGESSAPPTAK